MSNRLRSCVTASVLALAASAALAQSAFGQSAPPAAPTTVAPVTVQVAPPKVVEKQTYRFVQGYAAAPNPELDQIARWRDPVCVQVVGLPDEQAVLVKARIEDVAKSLGLPKPRDGCSADVEVLFTGQPQAMMDAVYKRREQLLGYYHRADGKRLKTVTHPIQAWYVTATLGSGGDPENRFQSEREVIDDPDNLGPDGCGINHFFTACVQGELKNILVVADTKALEGKDLGLIADYLVMLTLSQPKSLDACNVLASVLDVLAKGCTGRDAPDGLTAGDAAYLTALYSADPESRKWAEQSDIARRMAKILIGAAAAKR